jgi:hypothetical protein
MNQSRGTEDRFLQYVDAWCRGIGEFHEWLVYYAQSDIRHEVRQLGRSRQSRQSPLTCRDTHKNIGVQL